MIVTQHATKRIKQRMGIPLAITNKVAQRAYEQGIGYNRTYGRLHKYIINHVYENTITVNNVKIYNGKLFLFHDDVLITILNLPGQYNKCVENIKRKIAM